MKVKISGMVHLPKDNFDKDGLNKSVQEQLKRDLTVIPLQTSDIGEARGPLMLYRETDTHLLVPREFYRKNRSFKHEEDVAVSYGHSLSPLLISKPGKWSDSPPYDEQVKAIDIILEKLKPPYGGAMLQAACAFGKTLTALRVIKKLGRTALIVVNKNFFMKQWTDEINQYLPDAKVGYIQGPKCDYKGKDIVIGMIHTLSQKEFSEEVYNYFGLVVVDECHRTGSDTFSIVVPKFNAAYRYGLSIGPDSFIELRGGPFKNGWVGRIEDAFSIVALNSEASERREGFDILRSQDIQSRGFDGSGFCWKPVKAFMRHLCDRSVSEIRAIGTSLVATNDHSIYRVSDDGSIGEIPAGDIHEGDTVLVDDGANWDVGKEEEIDVALELSKCMKNPSRVYVLVDISSLTRLQVGVDPKSWWAYKNQSRLGSYLPLPIYMKFRDILPKPQWLYTEASSGNRIAPTIKLSDWAWMLGFWLGDGWISHSLIAFAVGNSQVEEVFEKLSKTPGVIWNPRIRTMKGASVEIKCSNVLVSSLLLSIVGKVRAWDKKIPGEWIMNWDETARRNLLSGLIDSDGCIMARKDRPGLSSIAYITTSKQLARSLQALLRSLGVVAGTHERKPTLGGIVAGRQIVGNRISYQVYWSFRAMNGIAVERKFKDVPWSAHEGIVRSCTTTKRPEYVYDLEMSGHPSFVANGILVHNSATPRRKDGTENAFLYNIGEIAYRAKTQSRIPIVKVVDGPEIDGVRYGRQGFNLNTLTSTEILSSIVGSTQHNETCLNEALKAAKTGRKVMLLTERMEQLVFFYTRLKMMKAPYTIGFVTGQQPHIIDDVIQYDEKGSVIMRKTKDEVLQAADRCQILLSTKQMIEEGYNNQSLDTIVLSVPISDAEQTVGRIRRHCMPNEKKCAEMCAWRAGICQGKPVPVVVDVVNKNQKLVNKFFRRLEFYRSIEAKVLSTKGGWLEKLL